MAQTKHAVDVLLDAFDDAAEAGDLAAMQDVLGRLRAAFAAYQQAAGAAGMPVDPDTIADCRAASEAVRTGVLPSPAMPPPPVAPAAPAPRPAPPARPAPTPAFEDIDDEPGLGYTGAWTPPDDEDEAPVVAPSRRPAPAPARPAPPALEDDYEEELTPAPARRPRPVAGEDADNPVIALLDNKRLLYGIAAAMAVVVFAALSFGIVVAVLLALAVIVPAAILMRRRPTAGSSAPRRPARPSAPADERFDDDWDEPVPARRRRR